MCCFERDERFSELVARGRVKVSPCHHHQLKVSEMQNDIKYYCLKTWRIIPRQSISFEFRIEDFSSWSTNDNAYFIFHLAEQQVKGLSLSLPVCLP